ncbi:MAG: hypothetical protein ABIH86_01395 [Planctomycetota bacterium]
MKKSELINELRSLRDSVVSLSSQLDAILSSAQDLPDADDRPATEQDDVAIAADDPVQTELPDPAPASLSLNGGATAAAATPAPSSGLSLKIGGSVVSPTATSGSMSAPAGGDSLAKKIVDLGAFLDSERYTVSGKTIEFLKSAEKNYQSIPGADRGGDKALKLWMEIVKRIHGAKNDLNVPGADDIQSKLSNVQLDVLKHIASVHGQSFPPPKFSAIPTSGLPSGFKGDLMKLLMQTMSQLSKNATNPSKALDCNIMIRELLPKIASAASENLENRTAFDACALVHTANDEASNVSKTLKAVKELLQTRGFKELFVGIGEDFGDNYSPTKYERKKVPSSAPLNQIVRVIQPGFMNSSGIPVQKAVVAVSEG